MICNLIKFKDSHSAFRIHFLRVLDSPSVLFRLQIVYFHQAKQHSSQSSFVTANTNQKIQTQPSQMNNFSSSWMKFEADFRSGTKCTWPSASFIVASRRLCLKEFSVQLKRSHLRGELMQVLMYLCETPMTQNDGEVLIVAYWGLPQHQQRRRLRWQQLDPQAAQIRQSVDGGRCAKVAA